MIFLNVFRQCCLSCSFFRNTTQQQTDWPKWIHNNVLAFLLAQTSQAGFGVPHFPNGWRLNHDREKKTHRFNLVLNNQAGSMRSFVPPKLGDLLYQTWKAQ
jgi:hypothetical protein